MKCRRCNCILGEPVDNWATCPKCNLSVHVSDPAEESAENGEKKPKKDKQEKSESDE